MSASLVGSEMCIRDSSTLGQAAGAAAQTGLGDVPALSRSPPAALSALSACLLYTSDAADDM
eukprot:6113313-Alexandrium_andersonii.AAC.1